ncbi:platelet binding protein GspB-like [Poecilia latipinna]|uniref:platelet binding protein GspB-like n=1 Tax=Poecilia latipinna TaxID=48699 RepID=UPI00072E6EDC|nr:PREDICTED: platelet binding protein GspB-like [Poecilia latipinna]
MSTRPRLQTASETNQLATQSQSSSATAKTQTSTTNPTSLKMVGSTASPSSSMTTAIKLSMSSPSAGVSRETTHTVVQTSDDQEGTHSFTKQLQNTSKQIMLNGTTENKTVAAETTKTPAIKESSTASEPAKGPTPNRSVDVQTKSTPAVFSPPQSLPDVTSLRAQSNAQDSETSKASPSFSDRLPTTSTQTTGSTIIRGTTDNKSHFISTRVPSQTAGSVTEERIETQTKSSSSTAKTQATNTSTNLPAPTTSQDREATTASQSAAAVTTEFDIQDDTESATTKSENSTTSVSTRLTPQAAESATTPPKETSTQSSPPTEMNQASTMDYTSTLTVKSTTSFSTISAPSVISTKETSVKGLSLSPSITTPSTTDIIESTTNKPGNETTQLKNNSEQNTSDVTTQKPATNHIKASSTTKTSTVSGTDVLSSSPLNATQTLTEAMQPEGQNKSASSTTTQENTTASTKFSTQQPTTKQSQRVGVCVNKTNYRICDNTENFNTNTVKSINNCTSGIYHKSDVYFSGGCEDNRIDDNITYICYI